MYRKVQMDRKCAENPLCWYFLCFCLLKTRSFSCFLAWTSCPVPLWYASVRLAMFPKLIIRIKQYYIDCHADRWSPSNSVFSFLTSWFKSAARDRGSIGGLGGGGGWLGMGGDYWKQPGLRELLALRKTAPPVPLTQSAVHQKSNFRFNFIGGQNH